MRFGPSCVEEFRLSEINSIDSKIVLDSARSNRYVSAYSTIGSKFQFHYQQVLQAHEDNVGEGENDGTMWGSGLNSDANCSMIYSYL